MSEMLTFGIFGTGIMAEIYGAILQQRPDCKIAAVVGNTEEKTEAFARKFDIAGYAGGDYGRLYVEHPDVDVTIIATPEWVRRAPVDTAIAAGQHILLEKPFAASLADALYIKEALERHDKTVELCHVLRHSPRFHALKTAVQEGAVGDIRHMFARRNSNNQRVRRVLGHTDLAYWLTPHDIDIMRWLTGSEVTEVFARSRHGARQADDYLLANLRFENGVDGIIDISWCAPPLSGAAREAVFEVRGTGGAAELEDFNMNLRLFGADQRVESPDTYEEFDVHGLRRGFFENMLSNFVRKVAAGDRSRSAIEDGFQSVRVCDMIRRSLDSEELVRAC